MLEKEAMADDLQMSAFSAFQNQSVEEEKKVTTPRDYNSPRYFQKRVLHRHYAADKEGFSIPKPIITQLVTSEQLTQTEKNLVIEQQFGFEVAQFALGADSSQD